jgi:NAD(P)H-nitrite reductase large subunit
MEKVVIVGSGIAALQACKGVRSVNSEVPIILLSEEDRLPYKRTYLDKNLVNGFEKDAFRLEPESFFSEQNIDLFLNTKVEKVQAQ